MKLNNKKHDLRGNKYVGSGEQSGDDCGKHLFTRLCPIHGDIMHIYHNCGSLLCPICGRKTLWVRADRKITKVYGVAAAYANHLEHKQSVLEPISDSERRLLMHFRHGVSHAVVSMPPAVSPVQHDTLLGYVRRWLPSFVGLAVIHDERIDKVAAGARAKSLGHDTSCGIWCTALDHPDEYLDLRSSGQHVHLIGYVPWVDTAKFWWDTGCTFKRITKALKPARMHQIAYYLGTHAPLMGEQRHTVYHEIGMRSVENGIDEELVPAVCPECGKQLIELNVETGEERDALEKVRRYRYRWRDKGAPWVTYPAIAA